MVHQSVASSPFTPSPTLPLKVFPTSRCGERGSGRGGESRANKNMSNAMKFEGYVAVRRLLAAIVIFALFGARSVAATARDSAAVVQELQTLQQQFGGYLGVEARNLATGEIIRFRATERFPTASAIKFPTMAAYFRQVALNAVNPYQPVQLDSTDKKPGSGVLQFLGNGLHLRLADAVTLMIILSDNTATNLVIDHLPGPTLADRLKVVNGFLDSCGLPSTRLLNKVYSGSTKQNTGDAIRFGLGVSTPEDMAVLMERLYRRTLVDSASSEAMLGILNNQQDMDMLPRNSSSAATHTGTVAAGASPNTVPVTSSEIKAQNHRIVATPCSTESKGSAKTIPG